MVTPAKRSRLSLKSLKRSNESVPQMTIPPPDRKTINHEREEEEIFSGLVNLQNTCFINCILHVMASTVQFVKYVHYSCEQIKAKKKECSLAVVDKFVLSLHQVLMELSKGLKKRANKQETEACLREFLAQLRKLDSNFEGHFQHDAHEFFCKLLDVLHTLKEPMNCTIEPCDKVPVLEKQKWFKEQSELTLQAKQVPEDIHASFFGTINAVNCCRECENDVHSYQKFLDISITPLNVQDHGNDNLDEAELSEDETDSLGPVQSSFRAEDGNLSGENKFWCAECLHHNEANLTKFYEKLPPVLAFHIKRFDFGTSSTKLMDAINVPKRLTIKPLSATPKYPDDSIYKQYNLYAVVVHHGIALSSGHFTCYVKQPASIHIEKTLSDCCYCENNKQHWLLYDDDKIKPVSEEYMGNVLSDNSLETVYLLFYHQEPVQ